MIVLFVTNLFRINYHKSDLTYNMCIIKWHLKTLI